MPEEVRKHIGLNRRLRDVEARFQFLRVKVRPPGEGYLPKRFENTVYASRPLSAIEAHQEIAPVPVEPPDVFPLIAGNLDQQPPDGYRGNAPRPVSHFVQKRGEVFRFGRLLLGQPPGVYLHADFADINQHVVQFSPEKGKGARTNVNFIHGPLYTCFTRGFYFLNSDRSGPTDAQRPVRIYAVDSPERAVRGGNGNEIETAEKHCEGAGCQSNRRNPRLFLQ